MMFDRKKQGPEFTAKEKPLTIRREVARPMKPRVIRGPHSGWIKNPTALLADDDGRIISTNEFDVLEHAPDVRHAIRASWMDKSPRRPYEAAKATADQVRNCIINQVAGDAGNDRYVVQDMSRLDDGLAHEKAILESMSDIGLGITVTKNKIETKCKEKITALLKEAGISYPVTVVDDNGNERVVNIADYIGEKNDGELGGVLNIEDLSPTETLNFILFLIKRGAPFRLTQVRLQGEGVRGFADLVEFYPANKDAPAGLHIIDIKNAALGKYDQEGKQVADLKKIGGYGVQVNSYEKLLKKALEMTGMAYSQENPDGVNTYMGIINNEGIRYYMADNIQLANNPYRKSVLLPPARKAKKETSGEIMRVVSSGKDGVEEDFVDMEMACSKITKMVENRIKMFRLNPRAAFVKNNDPYFIKGYGPSKMSSAEKAVKLTYYLYESISLTTEEIMAFVRDMDQREGTRFEEIVERELNPETANKTAVIKAMDIKNWMRSKGHPDAYSKEQSKFSITRLAPEEIDAIWASIPKTTKILEILSNAGACTVTDILNSPYSKKRIVPELAPSCANCAKVAICTETAKRIDSTAKIKGMQPASVVWLIHQGIETVDQFISVCEAKVVENKINQIKASSLSEEEKKARLEAIERSLPKDYKEKLDIYYRMVALDRTTGKRKTGEALRKHKEKHGDSGITTTSINALYMQALASTLTPEKRAAFVVATKDIPETYRILKSLAEDNGMYAVDYEFVHSSTEGDERASRWVCGDSHTISGHKDNRKAGATVAINLDDNSMIKDHYDIVGHNILEYVKMKTLNPKAVMACWAKGAEETIHKNALFPGILNTPAFKRIRLRTTLNRKVLEKIKAAGDIDLRVVQSIEIKDDLFEMMEAALKAKSKKEKDGLMKGMNIILKKLLPDVKKEIINKAVAILCSLPNRDCESIFGDKVRNPVHYGPSSDILSKAIQTWEQEKGAQEERLMIEHIRSLWEFVDLMPIGDIFKTPVMSGSIKKRHDCVSTTERNTAIKNGDEWVVKFNEAVELIKKKESGEKLSEEDEMRIDILIGEMEDYQKWDVVMINDIVDNHLKVLEILSAPNNPDVEVLALPEGESEDGARMIRTEAAIKYGVINPNRDLMTPKEMMDK